VRQPVLLAYRALGLGDFLTGVPALRALAGAFPGHRRVLCAPAAIAPLAMLTGAVDDVADTAALAVPPIRGADVAVNLHGRGPQSHRAILAAEPHRLIGFGIGGFAWRADEHEVERWCRVLREAGVPADPAALDLPAPPWPAPATARGALLIHPGAASAARRWPASRFAAVARAARAAGRRVVVTGSEAERPLALHVAASAGLPEASVLAGGTDVRALAAAVAVASAVVCGDTGVSHLATALGTPSVTLFGPTPPALWGPPPGRPRHVALWAGRTGDPHADAPDRGLLEIEPADVLRALERLPRAPACPADPHDAWEMRTSRRR
jgi:ADP-heptose:LPS heptosyltransferase